MLGPAQSERGGGGGGEGPKHPCHGKFIIKKLQYIHRWYIVDFSTFWRSVKRQQNIVVR